MSALEPTSPLVTTTEKRTRMSLAARTCVLVGVLFVEKFYLNGFVNFRAAQAATGLATAVRLTQHFGLRFAVSFAIALALFVYVRRDAALATANRNARAASLRFHWLALHVVLLVPIAAVLYNFYGTHGVHLPFPLLAAAALVLTILCVAALVLGLAPWSIWRQGIVAIGDRWLYALGAALAATVAIVLSQQLWVPTAQITFDLVQMVLRPFLPTLRAVPATRDIYAPHFAVGIDPICSGLEGIGLIIAFCTAWLVFFRDEYRFPRALVLIPIGVTILFVLNVLRIAALVLIGNAGHPAIAVFGFHSQAGWISFNAVACGLVFVSRRSRWLNTAAAERTTSAEAEATSASNPTASYLAPFLLILAAGMIARSISGHFETWYPLRTLAGGAALLIYWPRLGGLDWRFSWRGVAAGVAVFAIWMWASHLLLAWQGMPTGLAAMSNSGRAVWVAGRIATALVVAPLAEELAYRGFLLRRLVAADFESVPFGSVGWIPVLVTAVAYGILNGPLWAPGIAAGVIFALLLTRTGRMGEAVAAHVSANALVCVAVLFFQQWQLW